MTQSLAALELDVPDKKKTQRILLLLLQQFMWGFCEQQWAPVVTTYHESWSTSDIIVANLYRPHLHLQAYSRGLKLRSRFFYCCRKTTRPAVTAVHVNSAANSNCSNNMTQMLTATAQQPLFKSFWTAAVQRVFQVFNTIFNESQFLLAVSIYLLFDVKQKYRQCNEFKLTAEPSLQLPGLHTNIKLIRL